MKVAFILPGRGGRCGGIRSTVVTANHLLARGHEVRILYRNTPLGFRSTARQLWNGIVHRRATEWLPDFQGPTVPYRDIAELDFPPGEILVGVGMWCSAQLGRLGSLPNPKLQFIRGLTPWMPDVMGAALSLPLPRIAVSHAVADEIEASYGSDHLLGVVQNGVEHDKYFPAFSEEHRDGVGTIYSSHPAKAPETVVEAMTRLSERHPAVPQYVFGPYARPKSLQNTSYSRYPSVARARALYSRSLVWIMASRSEGFPGPVLEAMACGCAVVATDCGGPRDVIVDGKNGFLVEVDNVGQLVDRVGQLLTDEVLRTQLMREARTTVGRFTWDKAVEKLEGILATLSQASR